MIAMMIRDNHNLRHHTRAFSSHRTSMYTTVLSCPHRQRRISSSVVLLSRDQRPRRSVQQINPAVAINRTIVDLGRKKQWKEILRVYEQEGSNFDNINYATVMSQLGRIHSFDKRHQVFLHFLDDLGDNLERRGFGWFGTQSAANIVHAVGKMKLSNKTGKRILHWMSKSENVQGLLAEAEPQTVSNIAWACATLGFDAPNLFAEIDHRSEWLVKEGNPQSVANSAWACATLGFDAPKLFAEIDQQAKWLVKAGKPQEVVNTAWSCATLGFDAPNLFAEIDQRAKWLVEEGNPQDVANTALSCAKLGFDAPNLFAEIDHNAKWLVKEGKPQIAANTAWSCAKLGFNAPNLFAVIDHRSEWLVKEGNPQEVANTAWACATLGFDASNLFAKIEASRNDLLPNLTEQGISNMCFAISIAGFSAKFKKILVDLWDMTMRMPSWDGFHDENLIQLAQAQLYAKLAGVDLGKVPDALSARIDRAMKELDKNTVSESQRDIASVLRKLGISCDLEVSPLSSAAFGQMLAIDVACKEHKIAIEYDGQYHFLKELGTGKVTSFENGPTKAKRRILEQLGWRVINFDYRDWIVAQGQGNEMPWLREKLHSAGIALSDC